MTDDEIIESARTWLLGELYRGFVPVANPELNCAGRCSVQQIIEQHPRREVRQAMNGVKPNGATYDWSSDLMDVNDAYSRRNEVQYDPDIVTRVREFLERENG